jgi:hypothetical protein
MGDGTRPCHSRRLPFVPGTRRIAQNALAKIAKINLAIHRYSAAMTSCPSPACHAAAAGARVKNSESDQSICSHLEIAERPILWRIYLLLTASAVTHRRTAVLRLGTIIRSHAVPRRPRRA